MTTQTTIIPHNQQPLVVRNYPSKIELDGALQNAARAQKAWSNVSVQERINIGRKFMVSNIEEHRSQSPGSDCIFVGWIQEDERRNTLGIDFANGSVSWIDDCDSWDAELDKPYRAWRSPISQTAGEIRGFLERAEYMVSIADSSLADVSLEDTDKPGFRRFIKRTPLGVVLVIAPWKFVVSLFGRESNKFWSAFRVVFHI